MYKFNSKLKSVQARLAKCQHENSWSLLEMSTRDMDTCQIDCSQD